MSNLRYNEREMNTGIRFGVGLALALVAMIAVVGCLVAFGGACLGNRSMGDEPIKVVGSTEN